MFWEIYIRLCRSKGLSANAVARELSIASGTVTEWKKGRIPQNATLKRLSDYFGVSVNYLLGKEGTKSGVAAQASRRGVRVPVYDTIARNELIEIATAVDTPPADLYTPLSSPNSIAAGIPLSLIDDIADYEEIPEEVARGGEFVALRIHGDSMEPRMMDGDVVIIKIQREAEDGDTVAVFVEENAICRRIKKTPEGILLLATNPKYEPIFCSEKQLADRDVRILGRVVELRAKY